MIHPNFVINITKAIILAKLDYGLPIYANIRVLKPPYNFAVRRSLKAFPTSPKY